MALQVHVQWIMHVAQIQLVCWREDTASRKGFSLAYVSPALAFSTISWRIITSSDLGREPAGISLEVSCIRTLCQSANLLSCRSNAHLALFAQVALTQIVGFNPTITTTNDNHQVIVKIQYCNYTTDFKETIGWLNTHSPQCTYIAVQHSWWHLHNPSTWKSPEEAQVGPRWSESPLLSPIPVSQFLLSSIPSTYNEFTKIQTISYSLFGKMNQKITTSYE